MLCLLFVVAHRMMLRENCHKWSWTKSFMVSLFFVIILIIIIITIYLFFYFKKLLQSTTKKNRSQPK